MESCIRHAVIILIVCLSLPVFAAQPVPLTPPVQVNASLGDTNMTLPALPFLGEIIGDDVYVRSGPGTNYYYCGKLKKTDKIKVVGTKFGWMQIAPPSGIYAWISKQYVQVDPQNSAIGTVTGDAVRVYAGSDDVQPMHSTTPLMKLDKGEKVSLLGEEKEGYYKITPPEGSYLWVSYQYVKPLGSMMLPAQGKKPEHLASFPAADTNLPPLPSPNEPCEFAPKQPSVDDIKMEEVRQLKVKVDAERAKSIKAQNFAELKKSLKEIVDNNEAPKAGQGAQGLLKTIERCEFAQEVGKTVKQQDEQFGQTSKQIEDAKAAKLAEFEDISVFAAIGQLKESNIFAETAGLKWYRVVDDQGKNICYAQPTGAALDMDLSKYVDKKVGLVGTIEPHPELGDAVVQFTNIVVIK